MSSEHTLPVMTVCLTSMPNPTTVERVAPKAARLLSAQADERKLATFTFEALKKTGVFSQTAVGGVFQGVPPLDLTSTAQTAALEHMCRRLAMARRRTTTPSPEAAQTYNERIGALWKKHGKELGCGAPSLATARHDYRLTRVRCAPCSHQLSRQRLPWRDRRGRIRLDVRTCAA